MGLVNFIGQQLQTVLVWNVLDHHCRATITFNHLVVDLEDPSVVGFLLANWPFVTVIVWWV